MCLHNKGVGGGVKRTPTAPSTNWNRTSYHVDALFAGRNDSGKLHTAIRFFVFFTSATPLSSAQQLNCLFIYINVPPDLLEHVVLSLTRLS